MDKPQTGSPADLLVRPPREPVISSPYVEPTEHYVYVDGEARRAPRRRPAGYWFRRDRKIMPDQQELWTQEEHDELRLVNRLREDVSRWRGTTYRGASSVTRDLLLHWTREGRDRPLFFAQREAIETLIYLAEIRIPGRTSTTLLKKFALNDEDVERLLAGEQPEFVEGDEICPSLIDVPANPDLEPLVRLATKLATGTGKTVVMAMLIAWALCNRSKNPGARRFPGAVLVVCPNLTVKDRLQVVKPESPNNYYDEFDLIPPKLRPLLPPGHVLVANWHALTLESPHVDGDENSPVVDKGEETAEAFARRLLGDLYDEAPILVINDEAHHAWRPAPVPVEAPGEAEEMVEDLEAEKEEATVWVEALDRLNAGFVDAGLQRGIAFVSDMSATPFYIAGSGYEQGHPFAWIVSDFALVDAIESGLVKVPRMPVQDTTGRPDPRYFRLWDAIKEGLEPAEFLPGSRGKPKPEVVYREAEGALLQITGQWLERYRYFQDAGAGQRRIPPVLIVVCDNTDLAEVFYRHISGESVVEDEDGERQLAFGPSRVLDELSNTAERQVTVRIDSKLLREMDRGAVTGSQKETAERLRRIVATVGKRGEPGEFVRCVVSVGMLTEGWDANNVTHILGVRAFSSQLLCEQVVGRGLRRMDYSPTDDGKLAAEYVDVYGIPFSVIPFRGRATNAPAPEDKPRNHVVALPERDDLEIVFPVVEGYAYDLHRPAISCDVSAMQPVKVEPNREPTATFVRPTVGYRTGHVAASGGLALQEHGRDEYYENTHPQQIRFEIARAIVSRLLSADGGAAASSQLNMQSRHQLFPQVYRYVTEYVQRKVDFQGAHPCELGLQKYAARVVDLFCDAIRPDQAEGEPPLLPILNRVKPKGSTSEVDFTTTKPCYATESSHVNQVVADTKTWESSVAYRLEQLAQAGEATAYVKNERLGFTIPYEFMGVSHSYLPDFLVRLADDRILILEVKGHEEAKDRQKHEAARKWVAAVNNLGRYGQWDWWIARDPAQVEKEIRHMVETHARGLAHV